MFERACDLTSRRSTANGRAPEGCILGTASCFAVALLVLLVSSCSCGRTIDEAPAAKEGDSSDSLHSAAIRLPQPCFSGERMGEDPFLEPRQRIEALVEEQRTRNRSGRGVPPLTLDERIADEFAGLSGDDQAAWQQARDELLSAGRAGGVAAALAQLDAVLDLERRLFGEGSARVAGTLLQGARLRIEHQDFANARLALQQYREILHGIYGADYWLAEEARGKLQILDRLERLPEAAQKLLQFEQLMLAQYRQHAERPDFRRALEFGERYYQLCHVVYGDEDPQTGLAANNLAHVHAANEDFRAATALYQEALSLMLRHFRVANPLMAVVLQNVGTMFQYQGRPALAESYLRLAIEVNGVCQGTSNSVYATNLNNLAYLYETVGDAARAIEVLGQARAIRARLLARAQRRLASDPTLKTAVREHQLQLAFVYLNLGSACTPSYPVRAEAYLREGVAIRRQLLGDSPSTARAINTQANLYQTLGDHARAKELLEEAVAMYRKSPQPGILDVSTAINDLATVHFDLGQYDVATELLAAALTMQTGSLGAEHPAALRTKAHLAKMAFAAGRLDLVEKLQQEVLQARAAAFGKDSFPYALALMNRSETYRETGRLPLALQDCEQAMRIVTSLTGQRSDHYALLLFRQARIFWQQGDSDRARGLMAASIGLTADYVDVAAPALSDRQQLALLESLRYRLDEYLTLTCGVDQADTDAYQQLLRVKGNVFSRQRLARLVRNRPELEPQVLGVRQLVAEIAALASRTPTGENRESWRQQMVALSEARERLERELAQAAPTIIAPSPPEIAEALPPGVTLVDFLEYQHRLPAGAAEKTDRDEQSLVAFVITADHPPRRIELGPAEPVAAAIDEFRETIQSRRDASKLTAQANRLRQLVWEPLQPHVATPAVMVSPDGALARLPWTAVAGNRPGSCLVDQFELVTVPAARFLAEPRREFPAADGNASAPSLLLVGDVDFDAAAWDETLATHGYFSAPEMHAVRQSPGIRGLKMLAAADPGDSFAEHLFGLHPGLLCGVALAGANRSEVQFKHSIPPDDDGFLTAVEVAELNLGRSRLVVLSACETGLGQVAGGEGLVGLQRAFHMAGARYTLASLWKVDDAATAVFMDEFYRDLWERGLRPGDALRQTQQAMHRSYVPGQNRIVRGAEPADEPRGDQTLSPYYWAAFVLSGDGW